MGNSASKVCQGMTSVRCRMNEKMKSGVMNVIICNINLINVKVILSAFFQKREYSIC